MIFLLQTKISDLLETQDVGKRFQDLKLPTYSKQELAKFKTALLSFAYEDLGGDIMDFNFHIDFSNILNSNTIILIAEKKKNIFSEHMGSYLFSICEPKGKTKTKKLDKDALSSLCDYTTYEMILDEQSLLISEIVHLKQRPISELVQDFPILALLCSKLKNSVFSDFWAWFEKSYAQNGHSTSEMDRAYKMLKAFTTDYGSFFTNTEIGIPYKRLIESILASKKHLFNWKANTFSFYGIDSFEDFETIFDFDEKLFLSSLHLFHEQIKGSNNTYTSTFTSCASKTFSMAQNMTKHKRFVALCKAQKVAPVFLGKRLISF